MEKAFLTIEVIQGIEGPCLSVNGYRVAGPKPWGGGTVVMIWKVDAERIRDRMKTALNK